MRRLILLVALLSACPKAPTEPTASSSSAGSSSTDDSAATTPCGKAWAQISKLGCKVTVPTNATWTVACTTDQANGIDMKTSCVISATSCSAISKCLGN